MNKKIKSFLGDNFGKNYLITPTNWSSKVLSYNMKYIIYEFLIISIIGGLLISSINLIKGVNYGYTFIGLSTIIALIRVFSQLKRNHEFIEIPTGHIGLVEILKQRKGSYVHDPYRLSEGLYRKFVSVIFLPRLFSAKVVPINHRNLDSTYSRVLSKDGHPMDGETTEMFQSVNYWKWLTLLLSSRNQNIHFDIIDDIMVNAMNAAADNSNILAIIKATKSSDPDASEIFKGAYLEELQKMKGRIQKPKVPLDEDIFEGDDVFYVKEIGMNVRFGIKNRQASTPEMRAAIEAETIALQNKIAEIIHAKTEAQATEIKANAEKIKLILEGEGKAKAEYTIAEMASEAFNKAYKDNIKANMPSTDASHKAALTANAWATEILSDIGNSDGTPLQSGGFDIAKIFALIKAFQAKKGDEN